MKPDVEPIPLSPALLSRLERELTDPLVDRLRRFALTRVAIKRRRGVPCFEKAEDEAEIMAQDAVTLTVLGHRQWHPEVDLYTHLWGVIRSESSKEAAHAKKFCHTSVDALSMDESHGGDAGIHADITRGGPDSWSRPGHIVSAHDANRRLLDQLRVLSHREPTVAMLLDAYEAGCTTRKEVLAATQMSPGDYRNARRKLDRMIAALPDNLNEGAHDALEITYDY